MAKIDTKLFETVGYNLGMSRLVKDMQYVDYVKTLKENIDKTKTYNKQQKDENPYGLPIEKMGRNERESSTQYIVGLSNQIKELGKVTEGKNIIDSETGEKRKATKEDVENARNQMDKLDLQIKSHSDHLETKVQLVENLKDREIQKSATEGQILNYQAIQNNTQDQRFNEETNEYEWFDHTVNDYVPISKFNTGSAYDNTLEKAIDNNYIEVREMTTQLKFQKNPDNFKAISQNYIDKMQAFVKENPEAIKNLLFEKQDDSKVSGILDSYMQTYYNDRLTDDGLTYAMEQSGITSFEEYKNSELYDADLNRFKQSGEIDTQMFLNSYESMINNEFKKYLPEPEEKKEDKKDEDQDDYTDDGNEVQAFNVDSLSKEEATKYILDNIDSFSFDKTTVEAIKKGERPLNRLIEYIKDPSYQIELTND